MHADQATVARAYVAEASKSTRQSWASRDPLRRRMLALADLGAAVTATASLSISGLGVTAAAEALVFLPVWILTAKLFGLYDRDHRTLRHLTVDELPFILMWAITCVAGLALFLDVTPIAGVGAATAIRVVGVAFAAALVLRSLARVIWRHVTPREQVVSWGVVAHQDGMRFDASAVERLRIIATTGRQFPVTYNAVTILSLGLMGTFPPGADNCIGYDAARKPPRRPIWTMA